MVLCTASLRESEAVAVVVIAGHFKLWFGLVKLNQQPAEVAESTRVHTSKCGPPGLYSRHLYLYT